MNEGREEGAKNMERYGRSEGRKERYGRKEGNIWKEGRKDGKKKGKGQKKETEYAWDFFSSFLPSFLPYHPPFLHSCLPACLPSFLPSCLPAFISSPSYVHVLPSSLPLLHTLLVTSRIFNQHPIENLIGGGKKEGRKRTKIRRKKGGEPMEE
jgi:hypothetical protein